VRRATARDSHAIPLWGTYPRTPGPSYVPNPWSTLQHAVKQSLKDNLNNHYENISQN